MKIWAISDLHLSISCPEKTMEIFGENWKNYQKKIESNWKKNVSNEDLILLPGDLCWAKHLDQALIELNWIDNLPGRKILVKGNHDYWWASIKKLRENLPTSIEVIQNDAININDVSIAGARLWDSYEYNFNNIVHFQKNIKEKKEKQNEDDAEKIFLRELNRFEMSLSQLNQKAKFKIAMTHYPPISSDLKDSRVSKLLEKYKIDICVFGHLHNLRKDKPIFGNKNNTKYYLTSCDYLDFCPIKLL
jgi:predicted phosphohydrolase